MIDAEIERLRRLRAAALRLRAVSRALRPAGVQADLSLLNRVACAAWRVARAVSGYLKAHPCVDCQRDAGLSTLIVNGIVAAAAAQGARTRERSLRRVARQLHKVVRQLDDARALTWVADLSEVLGRSQRELRSLLAETLARMPAESLDSSRRYPRVVEAAAGVRR